ncbi:MAG: diaminopimelate dehydrogenase [Firmicutes bacterium]|nr:diaminopimelate dehydrogenase [Bacillota bacterium]
MKNIKIGILGYGNLGKSVEKAVKRQADMELVSIYSRRKLDHPMGKHVDALHTGEPIDILILCGGSASDLPKQTPEFARRYNVIDSFDHHQQIQNHYNQVDIAAREGGRLALISCGWDPGLFSMMRSVFQAILPTPQIFTFWGKGISQGHSDAIRRIKGVQDARQYTVPLEHAVEAAKSGRLDAGEMHPEKMHRRECFVVVEEGADRERITYEIKNMPDYFAGYETTIHYVSQEKLETEHSGFPHGGTVAGAGEGVKGAFHLELQSNPDFTAGILTAYSRVVYNMAKEGVTGCKTMMDIPLAKLCEDMFMHF